MTEEELKKISIDELSSKLSIASLTARESGQMVQQWLKEHPDVMEMMQERGTKAMKVWNHENRELIQDFAKKGAEGNKMMWEYLKTNAPEIAEQIGKRWGQKQKELRLANPEKYKKIDEESGKRIKKWIEENPELHKEICKKAQKHSQKHFDEQRENRFKTLYEALPEGNFPMTFVKQLKEKLEIPGNNKFTTQFKNSGWLTLVHKGTNGSVTDIPLYCKTPRP